MLAAYNQVILVLGVLHPDQFFIKAQAGLRLSKLIVVGTPVTALSTGKSAICIYLQPHKQVLGSVFLSQITQFAALSQTERVGIVDNTYASVQELLGHLVHKMGDDSVLLGIITRAFKQLASYAIGANVDHVKVIGQITGNIALSGTRESIQTHQDWFT